MRGNRYHSADLVEHSLPVKKIKYVDIDSDKSIKDYLKWARIKE